jgi:integrase
MLDLGYRLSPHAGNGGRADGKENMARPRYQDGSLSVRGTRKKVWIARWREDVIREDGTMARTHRKAALGAVNELSRREAMAILQARVAEVNSGRRRAIPTMTFEKFARENWQAGMLLALKPSSARNYQFQLDKYILPALGSCRLCDLNRARIQAFLLDRKREGYSNSTIHGFRTTLAKVLEVAVEFGYFDHNPAHGIKTGEREAKQEKRFLVPAQIRALLLALTEPCRTTVLVAVLTGMRIGEILALRWKRLDLVRGTIQITETFSDGRFGTPKTRSSRRVIPMSSAVREALECHRIASMRTASDDLVFSTSKGTPLSPKNLYNRVLAPACDAIRLPRVSWHSFRHSNATLLGEVGESLKTAQAILGHSDLETTLNTYMHAIPDSQRRAVEKVAEVLCPLVPNSGDATPKVTVN